MGNFLESIKEEERSLVVKSQTVAEPLQKIKEYYGLFKSVCDSFLIVKQKYIEIFESGSKLPIWDRESIGKIDGLELFCGLITFATQCTFKQKIKFWFTIFDFNEIKKISFVDLEYLVLCICNSIYKVLGKNAKANESEIVEWLKKYFSQKERIHITKLHNFCTQSIEVKRLFSIIKSSPIEEKGIRQDIIQRIGQSLVDNYGLIEKQQTKKQIEENLEWHNTFAKRLKTPFNASHSLYSAELSWVYGIKTQNILRPFIMLGSEMIYTTSTVIILYDLQTNRQRYYLSHKAEISSFCYCKQKGYMISSDEGNHSKIYIWDKQSLNTVEVLSSYHPHEIFEMQTINNGNLLVTIAGKQNTSMIIYDLNTFEITYSYGYKSSILCIQQILTNIDPAEILLNIETAFVAIGFKNLYFTQLELEGESQYGNKDFNKKQSESKQNNNLKLKIHEYEFDEPQDQITCGITVYLSEDSPNLRSFVNDDCLSLCVITGHQKGSVRYVFFNEGAFTSEEILLEDPEARPIRHIQQNSQYFFVASDSKVSVYNWSFLTENKIPYRTIDLNNYFQLKLFSHSVSYFSISEDADLILIMTDCNDFVQVFSREILYYETVFLEKENIHRISTLTKIQGSMKNMCLLQRNHEEHLVYLVTEDQKVLIINNYSHQIENVWELSSDDHIAVMDAAYTDDDVLYFVCGCKEGKLYIRVDNEENPKFYDCASEIVQVKISKDASYLLVSTVERYLYFFTQINKSFSSPRKLHFENEIPVCINFLDNNKMFVVNSSAKNVYLIEIPQLKHKNVQKQNEKVNISKMRIVYPNILSQNDRKILYSNAYLGGQLKYFLISLCSGQILFFENSQSLSVHSYVSLNVHKTQIASLAIVEEQNKFYSLGKYDNTLCEWSTSASKRLTNVPSSIIPKKINTTQLSNSINTLNNNQKEEEEDDDFLKIKELSYYYKLINEVQPEDRFLFRGTKEEKLNEAIRNELELMENKSKNGEKPQSMEHNESMSSQHSSQVANSYKVNQLSLRQPNLSLEMEQVFGLESFKKGSVALTGKQGDSIIYHTSRFLMHHDLSSPNKTPDRIIHQQKHKISCFALSDNYDTILYSLTEADSMIYIHSGRNSHSLQQIQTTHELGIIHLIVYKDLVLSYGILQDSYSINLHNYRTNQLIAKRTTNLKIHELIFIDEGSFVTFKEIRIWDNLYPSEAIGMASTGILLPNQKDVCLATDMGTLSIMKPQKGIFTRVNRAHESEIVSMKINQSCQLQKTHIPQNIKFQLLTAAKDDNIKIWNESFNLILCLNLRQDLPKLVPLVEPQDHIKNTKAMPRHFNIRGIDSRTNKIVVYLASGEVYYCKLTPVNTEDKDFQKSSSKRGAEGLMLNTSNFSNNNQTALLLMQQENNEDVMQESKSSDQSMDATEKNRKERDGSSEYDKQWTQLLEYHSCQTESLFKRALFFVLHPKAPIIATVGNDFKLIFRTFNNYIIGTYHVQDQKIICIRFSPQGNLIVIGFEGGDVKIFSFEYKTRGDPNKYIVDLEFSQKFIPKFPCEPINIQFCQDGVFFAVSFLYRERIATSSAQENQKEQHFAAEKLGERNFSMVNLYKIKQQKQIKSQNSQIDNEGENQGQLHFSPENIYYSLHETLPIKQQEVNNLSGGSSLYTRCVFLMKFISKENRTYLVMYEQYVNENKIRINMTSKNRFCAYDIEERTYCKKQFDLEGWLHIPFPNLVNVIQISSDGQSMQLSNNQHKKSDDNDLSMSCMCFHKNFLIYGGTHGRIHLLRNTSLSSTSNKSIDEFKQSELACSKTYMSQFSVINQMQISSDGKYLFVAGSLDECIVKYRLIQESQDNDLDYQEYQVNAVDVHEVYLSRDQFFNFVNNIHPLRQQIQDLLVDIEDNVNENVGLETMKIFGRRGYDRFNNLRLNQNNLVYTVGPNLIIQNLEDTLTQRVIQSDPSKVSYNPQVSAIDMKPHSNILILATEEESARLFVWDIRAEICLCEMQVNCSIIYGIKLIGNDKAVFYGINSMYQLVLQVVNWKLKKVIALYNFLHTAVWKIKDLDICESVAEDYEANDDKSEKQSKAQIANSLQMYESKPIQFMTCGIQHLSEWTVEANALIEKHFKNIPQNVAFFSTKNIIHTEGSSITTVTGCERGNLYLWKDAALIHQIKVQTGTIRSIEVLNKRDSSWIICGGIDSNISVCRISVAEEIVLLCQKHLNPQSQQEIHNKSGIMTENEGRDIFLTEFDVQSICCYEANYGQTPTQSICLTEATLLIGTRSGDVYSCDFDLTQKQLFVEGQVVYSQDHETITSTVFGKKDEVLYSLTTSGKLQVWDLKSFEKVFTHKFMKKAKKVFISEQNIIISFEKEIIFLQIDIRDKIIKINERKTLVFDGIITECCLSFQNKYIAVGIHHNESNEILIFELEKQVPLYHSPSLKYEIEFLDFSTDENYVLYKDKYEEIGMIYLVTLKRINTIFVEMKIEWQSEGLRISPKSQRIYCSYNCENKITTICKLGADYILVGDEMGTMRIFPYPPEQDRLGQLHNNCYTKHMNKITCISQHRDLNYLASTAQLDRSLIIWRKFGFS